MKENSQHIVNQLKTDLNIELKAISNWWVNAGFDKINHTFYAEVDNENTPNLDADFILIQSARLLWFFSTVAQLEEYEQYGKFAVICYQELISKFYDDLYKGFYWSVDANNLLSNDKKQSYGQAFCIYALCAYYEYSNNEKAINLAYETFLVVEKNTKDFKLGGYVEGFFRNWTTLPDMRLGVDDLNASKTMNNHLHLLEAYTALYKVSKKEAVQKALMKLLYLYTTRFVNSATGNTILFCDKEWTVQANIISPGHDIESAWLLYEALEVLGLEKSSIETVQLIKKMMDEIYQNWINEDGAILNENHNGKQDLSFDWWQQAEAVVGFFYAYQLFKEEHYLNQALKTWNFIQQYFKNTSKGEWFWKIDQHYQPDLKKPKSGAWKSPYHNGRMCLEILEKMNV